MFTSTIDIKTCTKDIIDLASRKSKGVYNLGTRDMISKKNFAIYFAKFSKRKILYNSVSCDVLKVSRGKNLGLCVKKIENKLGYLMPTAKQSIKELAKYYK